MANGRQRSGRGASVMCAVALLCVSAPMLRAQQRKGDASPAPVPAAGSVSEEKPVQPGQPQPSAARTGTESDTSPASKAVERVTQPEVKHPGVLLDRVVAVVNGEVILESDVALEQRLSAFQPVTDPGGTVSESRAVDRLINRALLLQQAKLQPHKATTAAEVTQQIATMRRDIPACKALQCGTDAGWQRFLHEHQVTEAELEAYVEQRLEALAFIELRFRSGIRISHQQEQEYYEKTMVPEYRKRGVKPPTLEALESRIQEVLLQQQVSGLLSDWLQSLRAQGTVQIVEGGGANS